MSARRWVVMLAVVASVGCGDEPYGEVSVATFNVALAPGNAPLTIERVEPIAEAVAASGADVICLQEVWTPEHYDAIAAGGSYEATVRHPPGPQAGCAPSDLDDVEVCVSESCDGLCGSALFGCAMEHCMPTLNALAATSDGCANCTIETVLGGACIDEVRPLCDNDSTSSYLFRGYDTALLSRLPVLEEEAFALDSYKVPTAVTFARVDSEAGEVDVYCAHFASSIGDIEYEGEHGSWIGEREFQIQQTLDYIQEKSGDSRRVVLLGDLNERVGRERLMPIEDAGLRSADEAGDPGCTVCTDNLVSPSSTDGRVDHVYLGARLNAVSFERIFDETITVEVLGTDPVENVETHLSDHYGLRAVLSN